MDKIQHRIQELLNLYLTDQASQEEMEEFWDYTSDPVYTDMLERFIEAAYHNEDSAISVSQMQKQMILGHIFGEQETVVPVKKIRLWPRIAVAAAAITIIFSVGLFYFNQNKVSHPTSQVVSKTDFAPGKVGATLTLANGKQIKLSDVTNGEIAKEAGITISKTADGQIVYEVKAKDDDPTKINTLTTARGETYMLTLPDQTKVWLNAASSLTYTAALLERGARRVRLAGEAYFQVAKDKAHPFIVESRGQQVEVLGTHFNINSYDDEDEVKTTLLEGSVKVVSQKASKVIRPGEQTIMKDDLLKVSEANIEGAVAWKNGVFYFDNTNMKEVMRQMSRWYDVDVVYEGNVPDKFLTGEVQRNQNASQVMELIKFYGLNYRIDKNKIIIYH